MLSILLFALMSTPMFPTQALKRYNSTILSQRIIYYKNDYLSVEISGEGDDSVIFMNIDRPIDEEDDIQLILKLKRAGEPDVMPFQTEIYLCSLICTEIHNSDGIQALYRASQAFHLDGLECPVEKRSLRLIPWIMPNQHTFEPGIKCGIWNYELTLQQCPTENCTLLIVADLQVMMNAANSYTQDSILV